MPPGEESAATVKDDAVAADPQGWDVESLPAELDYFRSSEAYQVELSGFQGPLAGFLVGLEQLQTEYLLTLPCDGPIVVADLAPRLAGGLVGGLVMMIVAPIAASLIQMAISRSREYAADARGAEIAGNPLWLAGALRKLAQGAMKTPASMITSPMMTALSVATMWFTVKRFPSLKRKVQGFAMRCCQHIL